MNQVEQGVANFRDFQADARDFFATFRANEEHRKEVDKRRSRIHYSLLALLTGMIIALFTVVLQHYSDTSRKGVAFFSSDAQPRQDATASATHY